MKSFELNVTKRAALTKQDTKKLRDSGMVPCVLYGGTENLHFYAPILDFRGLVYTPEVYTVNIHIDGKTHQAVMQEVQFHPVNDSLLHIDFMEINPTKAVVMNVPVKINGTSEGQRQGGKLITKVRKLKVKALVNHLPDAVNVDINSLQIGQSIRVGDLKLDGVEFLDSVNNVIVGVRTTRNVVENPAAEAKAAK
ncbi:MAG: 50S ribosomal protein L25/general stress protein Ctc [Bacteroidia bacterium]|jgi:large subunit ribosomal protein L25